MFGANAPVVAVTNDQAPVPLTGVFPAIKTVLVVVFPQVVWSGPALAVVGPASTVITTSTMSPAQLLIHGVT